MERAARYAVLPEDILLVGPTGSGKGRLAELIHRASGRTGAFEAVTGGQLTEGLWTSQLHGHIPGAFTDAKHRARGSFEQAARGTLFLDELQHWGPTLQSGLLQPLQQRRFRPLGAERDIEVTCRLIFATTVEPDALVSDHGFLPDLRYRLPALVLSLPSLAVRRGEILPLLDQFTKDTLIDWRWEPGRFRWAPTALRGLLLYEWPGNIRELLHVVKRTLAQVGPTPERAIEIADLELPPAPGGHLTGLLDPNDLRRVVDWALKHAQDSHQDAAELLGVHRNTFARYISRWGTTDSPKHSRALLDELGSTDDAGVALLESA